MPTPDRLPARQPESVPARLAELAELMGGESPRSRKFLRGLLIGALAGAAIVGSLAARRRPPDRAGE